MVTPAIVGKVNERIYKPGAFSWEEKEEIFAMDLRPHLTTWDTVKPDSWTGAKVGSLGPKASLEAQMEAAARHAFDYGGHMPPIPLPDTNEAGGFQGRCHNCGARGHRASDCRGVGEYTPITEKRPDEGSGLPPEDLSLIPSEMLIECPIGARDPLKAAEEAKQREEHNRLTAEKGRLVAQRRMLLKHVNHALKKRGGKPGPACDDLMKAVGGPQGLMFGDVPPGYQPTTRTCNQVRTILSDCIFSETPQPLCISVSRKEGVLRQRGTRYACFVWWGIEEICRNFDDNYNKCIAGAVDNAWRICRDRDQADMEEHQIRTGKKRPRLVDGSSANDHDAEMERQKHQKTMESYTAMGRAALSAWKDGEETQSADPVMFADVEGDEIQFEAWYGGGARYTVNEEARPPFRRAEILPSDPPQFPNARLRMEFGKQYRSVQLPDKHASVVGQLAKFFDVCKVEHNLRDGPLNRFEIEGQTYAERAKAARAALLLTAPPPVDEGRWS
eukprot:TRINITY_DN56334_c0_g1_i1.p1 TRINITY_DN56334_c0_g1~~TRINITY_DN56334_c0_g1_i1.p1  ORF type:complete len:501 (+),score=166.58 TRINITY_DN56334_c0_g1_i1:152-1654(+)